MVVHLRREANEADGAVFGPFWRNKPTGQSWQNEPTGHFWQIKPTLRECNSTGSEQRGKDTDQ